MNMNLYDASRFLNGLKNAPDLMEISAELIPDTIESLEATFEQKAQYSLAMVNELLAFAKVCKEEEQRLNDRRKSLEHKANRIKEYVKNQMIIAGINKLDYPLFRTYLQNDPPKVNVIDESQIPNEWWVEKVERNVDKLRLIEYYKETQQQIPGCTIEQGVSLRIK